jgi:hypothetical protein
MYEYLNQHPLVIKSKAQETHYFDWFFGRNIKNIPEEDVEGHRKHYTQSYFQINKLRENASLCTGESSPTYVFYR